MIKLKYMSSESQRMWLEHTSDMLGTNVWGWENLTVVNSTVVMIVLMLVNLLISNRLVQIGFAFSLWTGPVITSQSFLWCDPAGWRGWASGGWGWQAWVGKMTGVASGGCQCRRRCGQADWTGWGRGSRGCQGIIVGVSRLQADWMAQGSSVATSTDSENWYPQSERIRITSTMNREDPVNELGRPSWGIGMTQSRNRDDLVKESGWPSQGIKVTQSKNRGYPVKESGIPSQGIGVIGNTQSRNRGYPVKESGLPSQRIGATQLKNRYFDPRPLTQNQWPFWGSGATSHKVQWTGQSTGGSNCHINW